MNTELGCLGTVTEENIFETEAFVDGKREIPSDMDITSKMILEEIIATGKELILTNDKIPSMTTKEFSQFWNGVSEHTQSSAVGLH